MRNALAPGDPVALARELVAVDSRNPDLVPDGPGEGACAQLLAGMLHDWGFRVELHEVTRGRPNVVARIGAAGGPSLINALMMLITKAGGSVPTYLSATAAEPFHVWRGVRPDASAVLAALRREYPAP